MHEYRPTIGETVLLVNTGHERSDGQFGKVKQLESWGGALLATVFGTGEYRAAWSEMVPIARPVSAGFVRNGAAVVVNGFARGPVVKANGYSGPACDTCGGYNLTQSGACFRCNDCGSSSGCS